MLAAAALLASIVVGPEITMPAVPNVPAISNHARIAALSNGDFLAVTTHGITSALKIDGITGKPARALATPIENARTYGGIWASGDHALVLWQSGSTLFWIPLDKDANPSPKRSFDVDHYTFSYAVAPLADGYLVAWTEDTRVAGMILNVDGTRRGGVFTIYPIPLRTIALAGSGTGALLIGFDPYWNITTIPVTASGGVLPAWFIAAKGGANLSVAWNGSGYDVAWRSSEYGYDLWLAWTDDAGRPLAQPLKYAPEIGYIAAFVGTADGATLFYQTTDQQNVFVRFAKGGEVADSLPQPLQVAFDPTHQSVTAAFNGRTYAVMVAEYGPLLGALTDLVTPATARPFAYAAQEQEDPQVAVGDHQSFVAWHDVQGASAVARFRDAAFLDPVRAPYGTERLFTDGDRAVITAWHYATFFNENGAVASSLDLLNFDSTMRGFITAGRLPDGTFLAVMLYAFDSFSKWESQSFLFTRTAVTGPQPFLMFLGQSMDGLVFGGSAIAWIDDRDRAFVATWDTKAKRLGPSVLVDSDSAPEIAMAEDGAGHALVVTRTGNYYNQAYRFALVDLAKMTVVHRATQPAPGTASVAWTGAGYLLVSQNLDLIEIANDGTPAAPVHLDVPYRPAYVSVAHGRAGTLIVYTRTATDLGLGDAQRVFARIVTAPRHHAVGR